jgi:hypothetical protein
VNLFKINSDKKIETFIKKCKVLLPNIEKTHYTIQDIYCQDQITIDRYIRFNIHHHLPNSTKRLFQTLTFGIFSDEHNKFLDIVYVKYPTNNHDPFTIEKFINGYEIFYKDPEKYLYVGDVYKIEVFKIDNLDIFNVYKLGILVYTGFLRHGFIKRFFELKPNGKCDSYLPISKNTNVTVNKVIVAYSFSSITFVSSLYMYFHNIYIVIGIMLLSWCGLAINDFINPRRHPIINIFQAVVYAIIFVFLK